VFTHIRMKMGCRVQRVRALSWRTAEVAIMNKTDYFRPAHGTGTLCNAQYVVQSPPDHSLFTF